MQYNPLFYLLIKKYHGTLQHAILPGTTMANLLIPISLKILVSRYSKKLSHVYSGNI
jgi:hypothetical protein